MPYTDAVAAQLAERLGPDAPALLRHARNHPDPVRAALAEHLHDAAHNASRHEEELLRHTRILHTHLGRALEDLRFARTATRWELVGASGTAIDQAAARLGEAINRLHDTLHLYTQATPNTPTPATTPQGQASAGAASA